MTYPPNGDPSQNQYFGAPAAPSGPPPTGAVPAQPGPPAAPGYPPQYAPPPVGYPPQAPPTQAWPGAPDQAPPAPPAPATQAWQAPPPGQPWAPPAAPPPAGPGGNKTLWVVLGGIAAVVLVVVIGGALVIRHVFASGDDPQTTNGLPTATRAAPTFAPPPTNRPLQSSAPASAAAAKYRGPGDLCSIDVSGLGSYAAKKEKATPGANTNAVMSSSTCDFELRTASGMKVTYDIRSQVYKDPGDAQDFFDTSHDMDQKRFFDADLTGIGERAYGTNRDWDIGAKTSDYTIYLVDGNLYLYAKLTTFGNAFVPKDQLKPQSLEEIKAVLAKIPTS